MFYNNHASRTPQRKKLTLKDPMIYLPLNGKSVPLSREEAEKIRDSLTEQLNMPTSQEMQPPQFTDDNYLTRAAIYAFFAQLGASPSELRASAGRLHGRLLSGVHNKKLNLKLRCGKCKMAATDPSCMGRASTHFLQPENAEIEVSVDSLRRVSLAEFKRSASFIGPVTEQCFELLKQYL